MAITLENANLTRQRAYFQSGERTSGIFYLLKSFFLHLAANKGNPNLQLVNIDGNLTASDGSNTTSNVAANAACTLYLIYLRKKGTVATWFKATDNATTATTNGGADITQVVTTSADEVLLTYPTGHSMVNGITYTENTTATGSTGQLLANRIDGFIILGA
jgi:hypothetical protein